MVFKNLKKIYTHFSEKFFIPGSAPPDRPAPPPNAPTDASALNASIFVGTIQTIRRSASTQDGDHGAEKTGDRRDSEAGWHWSPPTTYW